MKIVALLAMSVLVFGCGGEPAAPAATDATPTVTAPAAGESAGDEALVAEGKQLFESTAICFTCHGPDAKGTALAPDLTDGEWLNISAPITTAKLADVIKNGVAEPEKFPAPMPAMGNLADDQIAAVAAYVLSLGS